MSRLWFVLEGKSNVIGPFDPETLRSMAQNGRLTASTQVSLGDDHPWVQAGEVPVLRAILALPAEPEAYEESAPMPTAGASVPKRNFTLRKKISMPDDSAESSDAPFKQIPKLKPVTTAEPSLKVVPKLRRVAEPVTNANVAPAASREQLPPPSGSAITPAPAVQPLSDEPDFSLASDSAPELAPGERSVVCPHCWYRFALSKILFVSRHHTLLGDPVLGPEYQQRFLPERYNALGHAIDARGMECTTLACPRCHLEIADALIDSNSLFFSIVGAPASGKSYYLTSLIWRLRQVLPQQFDYNFTDADATANAVINRYEQLLFLDYRSQQVALPKTALHGNDFTSQVRLNGTNIELPLPFTFTLTPLPSHPDFGMNPAVGQCNLVFYDNAGEHFEPGRDSLTAMATQHLNRSSGIVFLFDPLKDARMVAHCNPADPQISRLPQSRNQIALLNEMIARVRKFQGLKTMEKYANPLIVVIPKYDVWRDDFELDLEGIEYLYYSSRTMRYSFDVGSVLNVSYNLRRHLLQISPEIVSTAEAFAETVYFVPVSALGELPGFDEQQSMITVQPGHVKPIWAEVPLLLLLWEANILPGVDGVSGEAEKVTDFRWTPQTLICQFPGDRERQNLPSVYWGRNVYDTAHGRWVALPQPPSQNTSPESGGTAKSAPGGTDDSEFWNS